MSFEELFIWALDNGIELTVYRQNWGSNHLMHRDSRTYYGCRFRSLLDGQEIGQELIGETPECLIQMIEPRLQKIFVNFKMIKLKKKVKQK